eukprot:8203072-Pyramimonas_sp.AAC.2
MFPIMCQSIVWLKTFGRVWTWQYLRPRSAHQKRRADCVDAEKAARCLTSFRGCFATGVPGWHHGAA